MLFADEFSAVASASDIALKVEQARSFNASLILVPQTPSGMGSRNQRDRILGSVETVILHAINDPSEIVELAGSRWALELTHRFEGRFKERQGSACMQQRPKVEPNRVRNLGTGEAWVISRGRASKVAIDRAPAARCSAVIPPAQALDRPLAAVEVAAPKEVSYLEEGE